MKRTPLVRKTWWRRKTAMSSLRSTLLKRSVKRLERRKALRPFNPERKATKLAAYAKHLRSPYWKQLRREVFERDGYKCVKCGAEAGWFKNGSRDMRGLEAHHRTYVRWLREDVNDCLTLCRPCHRAEHAKQGWYKRLPL